MDVHLIDGTYELFRHFFAVPSTADSDGQEIGAVRGVLTSVFSMIEHGATHIGVATDHVVESFRNDLYPGYKTSEGVPAELLSQFPILEEALEAMGVVVWPMVDYEADDALASAADKAAKDDGVRQVVICTPDKDLGQCVVGTRVVQLDRRRDSIRDESGVVAKFGVKPQSIPDYLAVVGDTADGFPGLPGWGVKAAALTLSQYPHLEGIPKDWREWHPSIRKARLLSESLFNSWSEALLFRTLATLRLDVPIFETVEDLRWKGPRPNFEIALASTLSCLATSAQIRLARQERGGFEGTGATSKYDMVPGFSSSQLGSERAAKLPCTRGTTRTSTNASRRSLRRLVTFPPLKNSCLTPSGLCLQRLKSCAFCGACYSLFIPRTKEDKMRGFVWLGLGVLLFLAWAISFFVFHVTGVLIHLLLVFALISFMIYVFTGKGGVE